MEAQIKSDALLEVIINSGISCGIVITIPAAYTE